MLHEGDGIAFQVAKCEMLEAVNIPGNGTGWDVVHEEIAAHRRKRYWIRRDMRRGSRSPMSRSTHSGFVVPNFIRSGITPYCLGRQSLKRPFNYFALT